MVMRVIHIRPMTIPCISILNSRVFLSNLVPSYLRDMYTFINIYDDTYYVFITLTTAAQEQVFCFEEFTEAEGNGQCGGQFMGMTTPEDCCVTQGAGGYVLGGGNEDCKSCMTVTGKL